MHFQVQSDKTGPLTGRLALVAVTPASLFPNQGSPFLSGKTPGPPGGTAPTLGGMRGPACGLLARSTAQLLLLPPPLPLQPTLLAQGPSKV